MGIELDVTPITNFLNLPPDVILKTILFSYGWIPISIVLIYGFYQIWLNYRQEKWGSQFEKVLLAIDIPRNNAQSPKAVENLFTYLAGAHGTFNLIEQYWEGRYQLSFSFEIVSIDGYTQYLIRSPKHFVNLVETAVYSQYPDAEITEVNDYAEGMPTKYPDDEYDVWGGEFIQSKNHMYPIRTYKEFENMLDAPGEQFKDPMASLMDLCSSLNKGEQLWYQILVKPEGFDWMEEGEREVKKILNEKVERKKNLVDHIINLIMMFLGGLANAFSPKSEDAVKKEEKKDDSLKMMQLKPAEKQKVEAIHDKISKLGFLCKIRFCYIAKKEVMNKPKVVNGFVGFIKQFMNLNLNNIKPDMDMTVTTANYFFKKARINWKKNKIVRNYINRNTTAGRKLKIYTIDELASLWHFPIETVVKAPLVQKSSGRKVEPPMTLPTTEIGDRKSVLFADDFAQIIGEESSAGQRGSSENTNSKNEDGGFSSIIESPAQTSNSSGKGNPPQNLPFAQ